MVCQAARGHHTDRGPAPDGWTGSEDLTVLVEDPQGMRGLASFTLTGVAADYPADFDGNGRVEFSDFVLFAQNFGKKVGDEAYDARYDLDGDDRVNFQDFVVFASSFGQGI